MVQSLQRGQLFFLVGAAFFLILTAIAWKSSSGRRFTTQNATINVFLMMGALLPIAAAEVALRPMMKKTSKATIFIPDAELGWRLRPHTQAFFADTPVSINANGWRGAPVAYHKPDSVFRLLFIGDSVTFGHAVETDSVLFPQRTSQYVSTLLQQPTEFVNAGVPAYMTWQELLVLQREGMRYDPDLLVLGFVLNDVSEQMDYAFWQNDKMRSNAALSWIDRWAQHSALVWIAQVIGRRVRIGNIDLEAKQVSDVKRLIDEADHPDVQQAWQDTFTALNEMVAFCETNDLPIVLVVFPFKFQLEDPDRFGLPQNQLSAYAQQRDLPYLDLLSPLAHHVREQNLSPDSVFLDIDHLSVRGHAVVAQFLAQFLTENGLLDSVTHSSQKEQARRPESASPAEQIPDP